MYKCTNIKYIHIYMYIYAHLNKYKWAFYIPKRYIHEYMSINIQYICLLFIYIHICLYLCISA